MSTFLSRIKAYMPFAFAALFLGCSYFPSYVYPGYGGDCAVRLFHIHEIVYPIDERFWLPLLQTHIYLLSKLEVPAALYAVIPHTYFLGILWVLNRIYLQVLGAQNKTVIYTGMVLVFYAGGELISKLGISLYQEILETAYFYFAFYWIYSGRAKNIGFYFLLALGMLSRENFWVYYYVFGAFYLVRYGWPDRKNLVSYASVAVIPLVWIHLTKQPLFPGIVLFDYHWTLNEIKETVQRLPVVFYNCALPPLTLTLIISQITIQFYKRKVKYPILVPKIFKDFTAFSLVALIPYFLFIIVFDPYKATPYNDRMMTPVVAFLPVWILTVCLQLFQMNTRIRTVFLSAILFSCFLFSGFRSLDGVRRMWDSQSRQTIKRWCRKEHQIDHVTKKALTYFQKAHPNKKPVIGFRKGVSWDYVTKHLLRNMLYNEKIFLAGSRYEGIDILFARKNFIHKDFVPYGYLGLDKPKYSVLIRSEATAGH